MKPYLLAAGITLIAFSAAGQDCSQNPALLAYKDARTSHLPDVDQMSEHDKDSLESAYQIALQATNNQYWETQYSGNPIEVPLIYNRGNIETFLAGDTTLGILGILADSVNAIDDGPALATVTTELERSRDAVRGTDPTFSEFLDSGYRKSVSDRLQSAGCPHDLAADYGLKAWKSP